MANQAIYSTSDLITRIRNLYDETDSSNSYVSDAQLVYFLNQAQLDITARHNVAPFDSGDIDGSSFDSNKEYAFISTNTVVSIEKVYLNQAEIPRQHYQPYDDGAYVNGYGYYIRGEKIGIPAVISGNTVRIFGRGQLTELTTSTTPSLPAVYINAVVNKALAYCKIKEQDYNASQFFEQAYERDLARAGTSYGAMQLPDRIQIVV